MTVVTTEEERTKIKKELKIDDTLMNKKVEQIRDWMEKQPHLPKIPDDFVNKMIYRYLVETKLSTEKTKSKIDTFYAMRHQIPEIFSKKDPAQKDIRESVDKIRYLLLKQLTPEGYRVHIISFSTDLDKKFTTNDMKAYFKRITVVNDARTLQKDLCLGDYIVFDCRGFYLSHITELPWLLAQRFTALIQDGLPVRIKGIFMFNAARYIETVVNIMKPALKEKLKKRIYITQEDHTYLYKYIPKRILPLEFGGDAPNIEESARAWQNTIESIRDFLVEDEKRITDEEKRPRDSKNDYGQLFGINGTFNKLNID